MGLAQKVLGSRIAAAMTSPHSVDGYLEIFRPALAVSDVRATVVDIRPETGGDAPVATLTLQPTATWRGHRAGQYVQVGVEMPRSARRLVRCFSISSAASGAGEPFTLTIRAHDEGVVSSFLVERATPGLVVHLSQAEGDFTLPESSPRSRVLMISGGSGITPVMSQLRTLLRDRQGRAAREVTFVHFARSPEHQIFADEIAAIAQADNDVDVHLSYGEDVFSESGLRRLVPDYEDVDTWACGPAPMMELVAAAYGVTPTDTSGSRLRIEFFKVPTHLTPGTAMGQLAFMRSGRVVANTGGSLLEQAEAAGLAPAFGCRMGICYSCVSRKVSGTVHNLLDGTRSSLPDEDIRICVSAPDGDCAMEL